MLHTSEATEGESETLVRDSRMPSDWNCQADPFMGLMLNKLHLVLFKTVGEVVLPVPKFAQWLPDCLVAFLNAESHCRQSHLTLFMRLHFWYHGNVITQILTDIPGAVEEAGNQTAQEDDPADSFGQMLCARDRHAERKGVCHNIPLGTPVRIDQWHAKWSRARNYWHPLSKLHRITRNFEMMILRKLPFCEWWHWWETNFSILLNFCCILFHEKF